MARRRDSAEPRSEAPACVAGGTGGAMSMKGVQSFQAGEANMGSEPPVVTLKLARGNWAAIGWGLRRFKELGVQNQLCTHMVLF